MKRAFNESNWEENKMFKRLLKMKRFEDEPQFHFDEPPIQSVAGDNNNQYKIFLEMIKQPYNDMRGNAMLAEVENMGIGEAKFLKNHIQNVLRNLRSKSGGLYEGFELEGCILINENEEKTVITNYNKDIQTTEQNGKICTLQAHHSCSPENVKITSPFSKLLRSDIEDLCHMAIAWEFSQNGKNDTAALLSTQRMVKHAKDILVAFFENHIKMLEAHNNKQKIVDEDDQVGADGCGDGGATKNAVEVILQNESNIVVNVDTQGAVVIKVNTDGGAVVTIKAGRLGLA